MRFYDSLNFQKNRKICMENVVGEQLSWKAWYSGLKL